MEEIRFSSPRLLGSHHVDLSWIFEVFWYLLDDLVVLWKEECLRDRIISEIRLFLSSLFPPGMTSTSRCYRLLWSCMSSQTSTLSKHYGEQNDFPKHWAKNISELQQLCPVHRDLWHPLPLIAGSSCGVSVCQVKPRRSTEWWRRLLRGTASATRESSSRQVRYKAGYCHDVMI